MDMLLGILLADVKMVLICYAILALSFLANVVFSVYYNTKVIEGNFDWGKLLDGCMKVVSLVVGTLFLVVAIDTAMIVFNNYVPSLSPDVHGVMNVMMVLSTIGVATWKYIADAYKTFMEILKIEPKEIEPKKDIIEG